VRISYAEDNENMPESRINDPQVVAEVAALYEEYEAAFVQNNVERLTALFWHSPLAHRIGIAENLYGAEEIEAFRKSRPPVGLDRDRVRSHIVTFGTDSALVTIEFVPKASEVPRRGRQSQVWHRFPEEGWKIVAAHVSFQLEPYLDRTAALPGVFVPPEYRMAVRANLDRLAPIAKALLDFPLGDEIENAPVFEP
jgi:hypothetical protein